VLSGLLLNVALFALLRFKLIIAGNPHVLAPGPDDGDDGPRLGAVRGFMLYRRRDIKRMFAYSRSSTWASSRSRSAWAGHSPASPGSCT